MTPARRLASLAMGSKASVDQKTRLRIAAHLRRRKWEWGFETDADLARALGVSRGAVNRALKGERTIGFDVALAIHRKLSMSLDLLVGKDPEPEWFDPDYEGPTTKNRTR